MKLKLDDAGHVVVQDGKPVYVTDDGKEIAFDAPGTVQTIARLNGEAKGHRERAEKAEGTLKAFEGLDASAARDAMDKLSKIDAKKLVEAGDMDAAIKAAVKPYEEKLGLLEKQNGDLNSSLHRAMIGSAFGQSKFATEKLTPAGVDLVRSIYGDRLKVEGDRVIAYDRNGQKLYSPSNPGEPAGFDEAIEAFVSEYPHKEHILKGNANGGGGTRNGGGGAGGAKAMSRAAFEALDPAAKMKAMTEGVTLSDA